MIRQICLAVVIAAFAGSAYADSAPVFNMTQGTVSLSNFTPGGFDSAFNFSNGNGVSVGGVDAGFSILSLIGGGQTGNPFLNIGFNLETSNVNGATLFLFGLLSITGQNFTLPTSGTAFSTTLPVLFSGSFQSCQGGFGPFGGCTPPPTFLGTFNINGPGTVSLSFLGVPVGGGGVVWQLSGATYTLTSVPEPDSIVLLGTGVLVIFSMVHRRKIRH